MADDLLDRIDSIITELQAHPDAAVAARVGELLSGIDAIHRTALTHLVDAIRGMAGDPFINRLITDPAIRLLFMSYDLVPVDRRIMAEEALDTVRGPLHAGGIDVEIVDLVGGVVYIRLHGVEGSGRAASDVITLLEERLRQDLVGFQQLVIGGRAQTGGAAIIPLDAVRRHTSRGSLPAEPHA